MRRPEDDLLKGLVGHRPFADTKTVKLYGQLEASVYETLKSA